MSLTRLYDTLHEHLGRIPISEEDRHFYLDWLEHEIQEQRDAWQWISAAAFTTGVLLGFGLAAVVLP